MLPSAMFLSSGRVAAGDGSTAGRVGSAPKLQASIAAITGATSRISVRLSIIAASLSSRLGACHRGSAFRGPCRQQTTSLCVGNLSLWGHPDTSHERHVEIGAPSAVARPAMLPPPPLMHSRSSYSHSVLQHASTAPSKGLEETGGPARKSRHVSEHIYKELVLHLRVAHDLVRLSVTDFRVSFSWGHLRSLLQFAVRTLRQRLP